MNWNISAAFVVPLLYMCFHLREEKFWSLQVNAGHSNLTLGLASSFNQSCTGNTHMAQLTYTFRVLFHLPWRPSPNALMALNLSLALPYLPPSSPSSHSIPSLPSHPQ